jgi:hypothetical protein
MENTDDSRLLLKKVQASGPISLLESWSGFRIEIGPVILHFDYLESAREVFDSINDFSMKGD